MSASRRILPLLILNSGLSFFKSFMAKWRPVPFSATSQTWLLLPEHRRLEPGEEYVIETGSSAVISLPNGTELRLEASTP